MIDKSLDTQPARLLIVDDSEDNLEILGAILVFDGYTVQAARSGEEALKRAQADRPDLILLDILMPGMNGFEVCSRLKSDENTRDIPVIFVSSMTDIESKVTGFKVGGVDYINKPFQRAEILVRINTHLSLMRMRERLQLQNAELERLANTDSLTNLYNRRHFFKVAEEELSVAKLCGTSVSVTMIDLDHFKQINDTYGHLVGDAALAHVARLICAHCREKDIAARYGGEEFIILHPDLNSQSTFQIAETIRKEVENNPFLYGMLEIGMTLSAGVFGIEKYDASLSVDTVVSMADNALYQAKDAGRNQVVIYDKLPA